ncbi:hypothetical protein [Lederbergia citrea]|uniref:RsiX n=1 Tax=Lederbergia citrea TaxID=2833581 RepID=A0A942UP46_9BACI|nr:hypothetical protein [Lederbergia citrea]MBS4176474.1 hypothetical protein [Lederbergia citrea]MBS4203035.1 hypothetical protein [Lederbergia citrea]MBS4222293.1 hypothetical protein [Lederbergia citrea]
MPRSNHSEEKMIKLLKQLPAMKDRRSMHDIYRNVQTNVHKKQKRPMFIPAISGFAALLLFLLIFPVILQQSSGDSFRINQEAKDSANSGESSDMKMDMKSMVIEDNSVEQFAETESHLRTAVYKEDMENSELVTFGAVTDDAHVLPVSILLPKAANHESWLNYYKETADSFDLTQYGFHDINPLIKALDYDDKTKTAKVIITSKNMAFFNMYEKQVMEMLDYTLASQDIELVKFVNEIDEPVELGEFGVLQDRTLKKITKKSHYLYELGNGDMYIVPALSRSATLAAAIESLKFSPNDYYPSLIPENVRPEVAQEYKTEAVITFKKPLDLQRGDRSVNMRMIEGILLTAKEFGYQKVKFENIEQRTWEDFNFDQPIQVPYAPNLLKQ